MMSNGGECWNGDLLEAYRRFILMQYGLQNSAPGTTPTITMVYRRDYKSHPRMNGVISRKITNENEITNMLNTLGVKVNHVDFSMMSYREQVKMIAESHILIGVHGAALATVLYLPPLGFIVELLHSSNTNPCMHNLAKYTGAGIVRIQTKPVGQDATVNAAELKRTLEVLISMIRSSATP